MKLFRFILSLTYVTIFGASAEVVSASDGFIREAVCRRDEGTFSSIRSMIDAGALSRDQAINDVKSAIRDCVSSGAAGRQFLIDLAGPSVTIPFWLQAPNYKHGDPRDPYFGATYLKRSAYYRFLINVSYPQLVLLESYRTDNSTPQNTNSIYERMVVDRINDRDCLGLPPLFYAASRNSLVSFKWMLDHGGDPNMLVPFLTAEPGVASAFIAEKPISKDINGGGYALRDQFACDGFGPNENLMNAYAEKKELVPVWTYAIKNVDNVSGRDSIDRNYTIMKEALLRVSSVPARTIADLLDNNQWKINISNQHDRELLKILVAKGADINAKTRKGATPMQIFVKQGINKDALSELLSLGAKL